ncbi:amidohydrolase [Spongiivirga citrea]|uniref:Amidohydrolase family protein n=1 Tax=Spongiivirga citrea TaxID=1481457 RepID=A0A6M0CL07_9FLAO|nr:amidohydrolase [Spongiivirga citrea]NER18598.1 amidohydrolase family protein [Spongiivirga citrea]
MKKLALLIPCFLFVVSCAKKEPVDLIITNAKVYTVNSNFENAEAFAIKDGKFVAVGTSEEIANAYESTNVLDANRKTITPGLIDGHCHFYGLGMNQQVVDLVGTKSFEEVIARIVDFQKEKPRAFIQGRGWDQNDWDVKEFPTKDTLDILFPDTPLAIERIDGHAFLVNQKALDMAGITPETKVAGGSVILKNGKLTGILIDRPMQLVEAVIPKPNKATQIQALKDAEKICFDLGLTTVNDAGLSKEIVYLIDSLQKSGDLNMRVYGMISNYPENLDHFLIKGKIKTDKLNVRSVKVYGDGALGSRGATLKEAYSDQDGHFGAMITPAAEMEALATRIAAAGYQMNTHAIGDSANIVVLRAYKNALEGKKDKRWKVEHAQVITGNDFDYFSDGNIIPSVQPTHATSDMYWAGDRLGAERVKGAYAFKQLLDKSGTVVLGTDFPVERVSPFLTFYAAVARQDLDNYPEGGFQMENALSREETLKGMTIWAAHSNFEEDEKGSIEVGKLADFVILDKNIMEVDSAEIPTIKVEATYLDGKKVN